MKPVRHSDDGRQDAAPSEAQALSEAEKSREALVEDTLLKNYQTYYHLALSYVHNEPDASDIVQNGAYRAMRASLQLKNGDYVETWVYRIMLNEIFRFVKSPAKRETSWEDLLADGFDRGANDTYLEVDLQGAMNRLSPDEQAILELRYFEDRKLEDIADILDVNPSTVKSKLYRSLSKLREILQ